MNLLVYGGCEQLYLCREGKYIDQEFYFCIFFINGLSFESNFIVQFYLVIYYNELLYK